jgi:hypothetical protein
MKTEGAPNRVMITASVVAAAGLWWWAVSIYAPANTVTAQNSGRPIGNNSDLYARWHGTRELLLHGRNPYSPEVTREIQAGFYGRALDPANENDPKQQEGFNYPLYVVFLIAPFAQLQFAIAQQIVRWLIVLAIAASAWLWASGIGVSLRRTSLLSAMALAAGSYPAVMEFYQQNLAALAIFFLAAGIAALSRGWAVLAGFLLALATIKPEISGLMIGWLLFWSLAEVQERGKLAASFCVTLAALVLSADLLLPHWIGDFLKSLRAYAGSETDPSILRAMFPSWLAMALCGVILFLIAVQAWRTRRSEAGSQAFRWTLAWVASSTLVLIPKLAAYNQLLLIPVMLTLAGDWPAIALSGRFERALVKAAAACQLWQWAAALLLTAAAVVVPNATVRRMAALPLATLLALPAVSALAVLAAIVKRRN